MTAATGLRTWTLLIAAPAQMWSSNDAHRAGPRATSAIRKQWRQAAFDAARLAELPKHLGRVRFKVTFHFPDRIDRDALNYADTAKPVIDGFGPPFVQKPTAKKPKGASAPGWTLIPNDTPKHLESTALGIGPLWRDVLAGLDPRQAARLASSHGGLTVAITDLTEVDS